jgi:hypothetical protein
MLNEHIYIDVIMEPTPTEKQSETSQSIKKPPTRDGNSEHQTEDPLDDDSPLDPPKLKTKKSRELAGLETSLADPGKLPAERSRRNCAAKDTLAKSVQLALEDEEFEHIILLYGAAAISDDHKDGIDNPKSY